MLDRAPRNGKLSCNIQQYVAMIDNSSRVNCLNCGDSYRDHEALNTPCGHYYCGDCLVALVEAFTRDESLFPLRCCQDPIPVVEVLPVLSPELRTLFQRKHAEFSVLSKDRLYCSNPSCSTFLGSSEGQLSLAGIKCPRCHVNTCPKCKESAHPGEGCGVSASTEALQALAKSQGWQTCPGCDVVVELNLGCYHMTCRCRTHFCYLCAARWKTCDCVQWDEARLIVAAQERVENEVGQAAAARLAPDVFAERVERRAATMRDNHHCERHSWRYRQGGGTCGECFFRLPSYLLVIRLLSLSSNFGFLSLTWYPFSDLYKMLVPCLCALQPKPSVEVHFALDDGGSLDILSDCNTVI